MDIAAMGRRSKKNRERHGFHTPASIQPNPPKAVRALFSEANHLVHELDEGDPEIRDPDGGLSKDAERLLEILHTLAVGYPSDADLMLGKLMLVVTEVAEAAEAVRKGDFSNFAEELADTEIRIGDIDASAAVGLASAIAAKMDVNEDRARRHGKLTNL